MNMTKFEMVTNAAGTPPITVVVVVVEFDTLGLNTWSEATVVGVVVVGSGVTTVTGALAKTMGRAKADTTIPVVMNQASSLQGLLEESSLCLLAIKVGIGERR